MSKPKERLWCLKRDLQTATNIVALAAICFEAQVGVRADISISVKALKTIVLLRGY